ncbi:RHS repeat-associated core domain-containing protein [Paenibacillus marchantiae]|uniref:RHS repeat-associated core domain-containing protein n=1 Tax=Paenibacillus marchantiae TaxID=3026433 RepID=UPI00237C334B|nr:RHS repeat-associated core domain-containing protein [Paenibacillus marchantiae]WDQ32656.1 RHS repeat-associated core domain-containing protein [Paenibacillus marchantiae]
MQITVGYVYDATGKLTARQIAGANQLQSYVTNGHGDVTEVRDASGNVLNRYTYDIWGNPETTEETVPNVLRYAGEYWDEVTGLQYLRARWYDPSTARFINEDTVEGELTNPLSLHLYTYVENNPLIYVDSSGESKRPAKNSLEGLASGSGSASAGAGRSSGGSFGGGGSKGGGRGSSSSGSSSSKPSTSSNGQSSQGAAKLSDSISSKAFKQIFKKWGKQGVDAFVKAANKGLVGSQGQNGIKLLKGDGLSIGGKTYTHEIKVLNKDYGDYRIFGYLDEAGKFIFDQFKKGLH